MIAGAFGEHIWVEMAFHLLLRDWVGFACDEGGGEGDEYGTMLDKVGDFTGW